MHQTITSVQTGELVSDGYVKLVFVADDRVVKAPEATVRRLARAVEQTSS